MLITDRRIRLIFIALAGMEAAVLTPWLLLLFGVDAIWRHSGPLRQMTPLSLFLTLWVGLLVMLAALDLLGRSHISDNAYRLAVLGLVTVTALLGVRLFVYPRRGLFDLGWLVGVAAALIDFQHGLRPASMIFILSFFLWLRGSSLSSRAINFLGVGLSFRLGLLVLLVGGGVVATRLPGGTSTAVLLLGLYFVLGLLAVSLARTDDKAASASDSTGGILPWTRLVQLLVMIGVTAGLAFAIGAVYTPERMVATLHRFDPLWNLLGQGALVLLYAFAYVMAWVARGFLYIFGPFFENLDLSGALAQLQERLRPPDIQEQPTELVEPWRYAWLVGIMVRALVVGGVLVLLLWLVFVFLERRRSRGLHDEVEEAAGEQVTFGRGALQRGWERLKNLAGLVRRYGVGRELLAAISVENIYANLTRIARERGHPRRPALPPDDYLPELGLAFPGHDEALLHITDAYMRVHYGDRPVRGTELEVLRALYEDVRRTPETSAET